MLSNFISARPSRRSGPSAVAMAIALATGAAVGVVALEAPASAQKRGSGEYSKEFRETYSALQEAYNAEVKDVEANKARVPALVPLLVSADEKMVGGQLIFNIGTEGKDPAMQSQGVELMLESGKVPPERLGQFNFIAGQLAYQLKDWSRSRDRVNAAIAAGYTANDPEPLIAETYFNEDRYEEGLSYLKGAIDSRITAGSDVPEAWIERGLAVATNNDIGSYPIEFAELLVSQYPSEVAWYNAIAVQRNVADFGDAELLDLMRLSARTQSMRYERDYIDYINAADARRLPNEVGRILQQGEAAGLINSANPFIAESRAESRRRGPEETADLPSLERDAMASGATARLAMVAGDSLLSNGKPARAEALYRTAMSRGGVNGDQVLTRLGIAQIEQGQYAEAQQTLSQVQGAREAIARLWSLYAVQAMRDAQPTDVVPMPTETSSM